MSKWVSCGFEPVVDMRAREVEDQLIREKLPLIISNSGRILSTPRYFFCQPLSAFLSCPYVFGGGETIPLGVLVLLWRAGKMKFDCPACGALAYGFGVGGSVLSGSGSVRGICIGCRQWRCDRRNVAESILAAGPLIASIRNEPLVEKGKRPRFDWTAGLVGKTTPDRVIVPVVEPVVLEGLIQEVTGSSASPAEVSSHLNGRFQTGDRTRI
jgi:hypothetical protein